MGVSIEHNQTKHENMYNPIKRTINQGENANSMKLFNTKVSRK